MLKLFRIPAALVLALLLVPATANADVFTPDPMPYCTMVITTNCIVSATVDTVPVPEADATYDVIASRWVYGDPTHHFDITVDLDAGGQAINPAQVWVVTINTGSIYPMWFNGRGKNIAITRGGDAGSGYTSTITMSSVPMSYTASGCNGNGTCPTSADTDTTGTLNASADDALFVDSAAERASYNGFYFFSSADWGSIPPQLNTDTNTIVIDVGNSHFKTDGTTLFKGHFEIYIPSAMLSYLYNVNDPAHLTPGSFALSTGGGSPTTSVTVSPSGVLVIVDNLGFSKRKLKVVGRTTPGRPKNLRSRRTSSTTATIRSTGARSRGSKVLGYDAVCKSRVDRVHAWTKRTRKLPIRLTGLRSGYSYKCTVRARSRAGLGLAAKVRIKATP